MPLWDLVNQLCNSGGHDRVRALPRAHLNVGLGRRVLLLLAVGWAYNGTAEARREAAVASGVFLRLWRLHL